MPRISLLIVTLLAISAQSCGYSLVGRGSALPPGVYSASIAIFKNLTSEPNLETTLTNAVRSGFIRDGRLLIKSKETADMTIAGVVESYNLRSISYDSENKVTNYQVTIVTRIVATLRKSNKVYMQQKIETNWQYEVDDSMVAAESSRLEATQKTAAKMAEQVVSLIIDAF